MTTRRSTTQRKVRKPSTGDEIIRGLSGLRESLAEGEPLRQRFTTRTIELELAPPTWSSADVRALRTRLCASQSVFARLIGVSAKTVQAWEQGGKPPPMACRLLECIRADVRPWLAVIRDSAVTRKAG